MIKEIIKNLIPWMNIEKKIYKKYLKSFNLYKNGKVKHANFIYFKMQKDYNCAISPQAKIGKNLSMPHPMNIVIGNGVVLGDNATIYQGVTIGQNNEKYPTIGKNIIVYAGAKIIGDVKIGDNVIVGANAVVTHDVPDNCVVAGIPAKVIKKKDK